MVSDKSRLTITSDSSKQSLRRKCRIRQLQRPLLIEDETSNDSDIIKNLIDYEDGQEEPDFWRRIKIEAGIQLSKNYETIHFLNTKL
ncbi:hypothetical protein TNCV_4846731 [Trichonephila clavipes]|nr:hypothetical protein TNCV_4846731 [Trichonephila clavipes]